MQCMSIRDCIVHLSPLTQTEGSMAKKATKSKAKTKSAAKKPAAKKTAKKASKKR